ncbi:ABC transporter permease [Actinoallomurus purpureus]|uniref:ABC transporter permease n=1 Tax=Actinoallomurus purpureus TaxID=478114 RepID=UPI0020930545|nr:ABC transporter permease [Actinoallomurus purpureus]MCO6004455.1 ABC transporter permease [Actinoallomurus purpureus]
MIWLAWRQFRTQAAVVFGATAVLAALLAATGPRLVHLYHAHGRAFLDELGGTESSLYLIGTFAVLFTPALVGTFWGAPLVTRELDAGTHRLAWTLTTRTRWLVTRLGVVGLAAMAATGLLSLAVTWWSDPIDAAIAENSGGPGPGVFLLPRMHFLIFDTRGVVAIGYAAFAFVLGVTIGVIVRRTIPAMAVLLVLFTVTQATMALGVRSHLLPPEHVTTRISSANLTLIDITGNLTVTIDKPGAWIVSQHTVNAAGQVVSPPSWVEKCPLQTRQGSHACFDRLTALGYRQLISYHPAGRFWTFQWEETAIYLALALLLGGFCTWWLRRLS